MKSFLIKFTTNNKTAISKHLQCNKPVRNKYSRQQLWFSAIQWHYSSAVILFIWTPYFSLSSFTESPPIYVYDVCALVISHTRPLWGFEGNYLLIDPMGDVERTSGPRGIGGQNKFSFPEHWSVTLEYFIIFNSRTDLR